MCESRGVHFLLFNSYFLRFIPLNNEHVDEIHLDGLLSIDLVAHSRPRFVSCKPTHIRIYLTGLFGVYFVADPKKVQDMSYHVLDKMVRMCHQLTEDELERAKTQLKSSMLTQVILVMYMITWTKSNLLKQFDHIHLCHSHQPVGRHYCCV